MSFYRAVHDQSLNLSLNVPSYPPSKAVLHKARRVFSSNTSSMVLAPVYLHMVSILASSSTHHRSILLRLVDGDVAALRVPINMAFPQCRMGDRLAGILDLVGKVFLHHFLLMVIHKVLTPKVLNSNNHPKDQQQSLPQLELA